ncbi:hypothetical protein GH733_007578 [Mirounga leonina]|nr:hypothetical protein GH733_007578 [Mirounga leonina]
MPGAMVFRSAGISLSGGIPEVEGSDSGCQDKLTHLTLSSSHPEGTSSPEERGHSDADATKPQLDARHPVLVGSELGARRLRPLPMTSPTARNSPPFPAPPAAILGVGGSLFRRLYARKRISSFLFEGGDLTQRPNSLPVCTRSTEGFGPVGSFEV